MKMDQRYRDKYALFTAAKNEQQFIGETVEGVLAQTIQPEKWVIVSDGSSDDTDRIVLRYGSKHDFIKLIRREGERNRNFSSKVNAMRTGYTALRSVRCDYIGNLDADIALDKDYYEAILAKFTAFPSLGIAGGIIRERAGSRHRDQKISLDSVAGAVQLFRVECFEQAGGYMPQFFGGEDAEIEIKARMNGWMVRTFPEIKALHLRSLGDAQGMLRRRFHQGKMFYSLGYHPLFFLFRNFYKMFQSPPLIGGIMEMLGFCQSVFLNRPRTMPREVVQFLRNEQRDKMRRLMPLKISALF